MWKCLPHTLPALSPWPHGQGTVWPSHHLPHQLPLQRRRPPALPRRHQPPADPTLGRATEGLCPGADLRRLPRGPGADAFPPPLLQVRASPGRFPEGGWWCRCAGGRGFVSRATAGCPKCLLPDITKLGGSGTPPRWLPPGSGSGQLPDSSVCPQGDGGLLWLETLAWRDSQTGAAQRPPERPVCAGWSPGFPEGGSPFSSPSLLVSCLVAASDLS